MDRGQKQQAVASLKDTFSTAKTVIIAHYRGLTVSEMNALRGAARKDGSSVQVTKNTLAKIAANDTQFAEMATLFTGPTAIAASEDAVAAAKTVVEFANKNDKLVIVGGSIDGRVLDQAGVKALAKTPTLDQSRSHILGLLMAPAQKIASILQAPGSQVARVISAKAAKGE